MRYSFQDRPVSKFGPPIWNCDKSHFSQLPCIRRHNSIISQPITMKFGTHTGGAAGEVCHLWLPCSLQQWKLISDNTFHRLLKCKPCVGAKLVLRFQELITQRHFLIDQYYFCTANRHVHQDQYHENGFHFIWYNSVIFCHRGHFSHPVLSHPVFFSPCRRFPQDSGTLNTNRKGWVYEVSFEMCLVLLDECIFNNSTIM